MPPPSERCAIYCRQSDPGQSTLPEQKRWGYGVAETNAWPVALYAEDDGLSGDDLTRPGLAEIEAGFLANHKAGVPITRLIVPKTDRLSRSDSLDAFETLAKLRRCGLRFIHTTLRVIDLNSPLDRTLYAIEQDHSNNPFLATMAERALGGMAAVAQAGFWVGRTPLGYRLEKRPGEHGAGKRRKSGKLVIDEAKAPLIVELFERYAGGESTTTLAGWLTARVKPPSAWAWSAQTVRQLLQSEVYAGVRTFGKRARGKHVRLAGEHTEPQDAAKGTDNLAASLVLRDVPAIISDELFRRVQTRLAGGRRRGHHKAAQPLPLSGLGKCGACGGVLHAVFAWATNRPRKGKAGPTKRVKVRRIICANRNRYGVAACPDGSTGSDHDYILGVVFELLADTLLKDDAGERLTKLAEERSGEAQRQAEACRDALLRRLADLDVTLSRSQVRLLELDADMIADAQAGIRQLRQQREQAAAELNRLDEKQAVAAEVDPARFRAFWETCRKAYALFKGAKDYPPSLGPLLGELIEAFTVHWKRDKRGRATPASVQVELPKWLSALACSASATFKQCDLPIVVSRDL